MQYDRGLAEPLQVLWRAAGYCCAELLHAARERLWQQLLAHGRLAVDATSQQLLLRMSCPALKRYLRRLPNRRLVRRRPRRERKLRLRVPLSISQPKPRATGTFECDLVEHNGGSSAGEYIYTVQVVDVVTAWRCKRACLGKHPQRILMRLEQMRRHLSYGITVLDVDNDGSLLNEALEAWMQRQGGTMTRSRACKKNDNTHTGQKNGTDVRGLVGYRRYDTQEQCDLLNQVYALDDLHMNYCVPGRKLIAHERDDERGTWRK